MGNISFKVKGFQVSSFKFVQIKTIQFLKGNVIFSLREFKHCKCAFLIGIVSQVSEIVHGTLVIVVLG